MKVVLIGSGNVATVLGKKMFDAGHEIVQVIGRSKEKATTLASIFNTSVEDNLLKINKKSDIYLIAVADAFVSEIADNLLINSGIVVHTAGALSKDILRKTSSRYGVLYPLQSLRKEMATLPEIPVLVDGSDDSVINELTTFASTWSKNVKQYGDIQRSKLHVAAVIASNFTNYLFTVAEKYCESERLDFNMLLPLIKETVERLTYTSPSKVQTGPAARHDLITIEKHQQYLEAYPGIREIYNLLTRSIMDQRKE